MESTYLNENENAELCFGYLVLFGLLLLAVLNYHYVLCIFLFFVRLDHLFLTLLTLFAGSFLADESTNNLLVIVLYLFALGMYYGVLYF